MAQPRRATASAEIGRQGRDKARPRARPTPALRLDSPVSEQAHATASDAKRLHSLGFQTVRDLLLHLPFGWESDAVPIAQLIPGAQASVVATVTAVKVRRTSRRSMQLVEATVVDDDGSAMWAIWFNQAYLATGVILVR
jgi:RecG-like helicase